MTQQSDMRAGKTIMGLGHLALPKSSSGQAWLSLQEQKRQQAADIIEGIAREWLPGITPDFYPAFAGHIAAALDQRL